MPGKHISLEPNVSNHSCCSSNKPLKVLVLAEWGTKKCTFSKAEVKARFANLLLLETIFHLLKTKKLSKLISLIFWIKNAPVMTSRTKINWPAILWQDRPKPGPKFLGGHRVSGICHLRCTTASN